MFLSNAEAHNNSTAPDIKEERMIVFIHVHPAGVMVAQCKTATVSGV